MTQSHMVHQVLQRFCFRFSSPQSTPLPTDRSFSSQPSDEPVDLSGPYPELVGCLMYLMTCTQLDLAYPLSILACYVAPGRHQQEHWEAAKRVLHYLGSTSGVGLVLGGQGPVVLTGHTDASWVDDLATQRSSQGYTFSLGSGSVSWWSTCSSSVFSSSCEAEIYAGAMAAQELRWVTYLLIDLGERPRSPPVLYVDNKAMIALCREHRLEHRTKHIALRYFLVQELQQHGQLRLAYKASRANTTDVFTKALQSARDLHAASHAPCSHSLHTRCLSPALALPTRCMRCPHAACTACALPVLPAHCCTARELPAHCLHRPRAACAAHAMQARCPCCPCAARALSAQLVHCPAPPARALLTLQLLLPPAPSCHALPEPRCPAEPPSRAAFAASLVATAAPSTAAATAYYGYNYCPYLRHGGSPN
ncbi:unnamed protein product [Closterium sp. NIES-54]